MSELQSITDKQLLHVTETVAKCLINKKWSLATAESCTGGWVAKCCTDLSGSSAWFDRGFITYSNLAKQEQLNVSVELLTHYGAVSEQSALSMATGALQNSNAQISVAITGIAGPTGGTEDKHVGTVWIAWCTDHMAPICRHFQFSGNRDSIRRQAVYEALSGIIKTARD